MNDILSPKLNIESNLNTLLETALQEVFKLSKHTFVGTFPQLFVVGCLLYYIEYGCRQLQDNIFIQTFT